MPAEVQITELAVTRAKIERVCWDGCGEAPGAVEMQSSSPSLCNSEESSDQSRADFARLPAPPPGQKLCSGTLTWRGTRGMEA